MAPTPLLSWPWRLLLDLEANRRILWEAQMTLSQVTTQALQEKPCLLSWNGKHQVRETALWEKLDSEDAPVWLKFLTIVTNRNTFFKNPYVCGRVDMHQY